MIQYPPPDPNLAHLARKNLIYLVSPGQAGLRLDKFTAQASGLSRGMIRALIDFGSVWVGGRVCRKQSQILEAGDRVTLQAPEYGPVKFYEADSSRILYEDEWLLAYDKEAGLPCQQTPYDGYNNLFAALGRQRSGRYLALHHRLDGPTSGVMVFALRKEVNQGLARLFSRGPLEKTYLALVHGVPAEDSFEVDLPIAKAEGAYHCPPDGRGKEARTLFTVLEKGPDHALVRARPLTGRTHQIRLHLAAAGYPVLGDPAYGGPPALRLMLHALSLSFPHPCTGRPLTIAARLPEEFSPVDLK
ncbi:MAG: RluA family pseudouridine synthase [Thermodesulfobacteriota bacterium]